MEHNNKGFSLVELIVVMAVMAILISVGVRNLGVLDTYRTRECKDKIESALKNSKIDCLSKSKSNTSTAYTGAKGSAVTADAYLEIKYENKSVYVTKYLPEKNGGPTTAGISEKVSKGKNTVIKYKVNGAEETLSDGETLTIGYNRSSGAFLPINAAGEYCEEIIIQAGTKTRTIHLETKTGKIASK